MKKWAIYIKNPVNPTGDIEETIEAETKQEAVDFFTDKFYLADMGRDVVEASIIEVEE